VKIIAGAVLYEIDAGIWNNLISYLKQLLLLDNVEQVKPNEYRIKFQGHKYKIHIEQLTKFNCDVLYVYSDNFNTVSIRGENWESNTGSGIPKLLREYLVNTNQTQYFDYKMYEATEFNKLMKGIKHRIVHQQSIRKLYKSNYDNNTMFKKCNFDFNFQGIEISKKKITVNQPWTLKILESKSDKCDINEFFIKVGIELDYDNSIYYDCFFIPNSIQDVQSKLRIKEAKKYFQELTENKTIKNITTVEIGDELSYLITTNNNYVFLQELFWWS